MPSLVVVSGSEGVGSACSPSENEISWSDACLPSSLPGGNSLNNLIELKTINISPTDTTVSLLSDCTEVSGGRSPSPCLHLLTVVGSGLAPRRQPAHVLLSSLSAVSCSHGVPAQGASSRQGPPCCAESVVGCACSAGDGVRGSALSSSGTQARLLFCLERCEGSDSLLPRTSFSGSSEAEACGHAVRLWSLMSVRQTLSPRPPNLTCPWLGVSRM